MARIKVEVRVKCDRCGCLFSEDSHHGYALLRADFGEITPGRGRITGAYDLCDACERKVREFITKPPEIYGDKHEMG